MTPRPYDLDMLSRSRLLAVVLVLLTALGAATVAETAAAAPVVVSPRAGAVVKRTPLPLEISAPKTARALRVTLNGVPIADRFSAPSRRGRRTLRASASDALRYGRNVLVVRMRVNGKLRRGRVVFTVTRARPLVGAGVDRRVVVGRRVTLNGTASRPRNAPAVRRGSGNGRNRSRAGAALAGAQPGTPAGLRFRWRLVAKPKGSRATLRVAPQALQPPSLEPLALQPATPSLLTDTPGVYRVALTVVDRGVASLADTVTISATLATPLVPVDTAATVAGRKGVAVGYHPALNGNRAPSGPSQAFYPRNGAALQLVVLDRTSLQRVSSWGGPATAASISTLATQVGDLDDAQLAIITAWADPGWASVGNPTEQLTATTGPAGEIGATPTGPPFFYPDPLTGGQQLTFVGVPTSPAGSAWQTFGAPGGAGLSTLDGFLSPDSDDNYVYLAGRPSTFDLGPDGQSVSLDVGSATYTASLPAGQGGFTAVYLDSRRLTPAALGQQTYATSNADGTPNLSEMARMANDLQSAQAAIAPTMVVVRSIGSAPLAAMGLQPPNYSGPFDAAYATALDQLSQQIAYVGGSYQTFIGMATAPLTQNSYSLVGSNFRPGGGPGQLQNQGQGADIGTALSPAAPAPALLSGQLVRDHWQRYAPAGVANASVGGALLRTVLAEPSSWPFTSTSSGRAAVACIGSNVADLGSDPRSAYWTQDYTSGDWVTIQGQVSALRPAACPAVAPALFRQVRSEIATEIGWVISTDSYIASLVSPFTSDGLSSLAELRTITQQVVRAVTPPPTATSRFSILALFEDVASLLGGFEVPAADAIAAAWTLAGAVTPGPGSQPVVDPRDTVEDAADRIGTTLATQLQTIADNYGNVVNIVVADYAKLKTVGTLGGCVSGPGCTPEWRFSRDQQNAASRMYQISAERQIWAGIMPAAYPYVLMTSSDTNTYNGTFQGPQEQISGIGCDFAQPFPVSSPSFLRYGIRAVGDTPFLVFSQRDFKGVTGSSTNSPPARMLTTLFAPLDPGGNPDKGGLGVDQYDFMVTNWTYSIDPTRAPAPALKAWQGC